MPTNRAELAGKPQWGRAPKQSNDVPQIALWKNVFFQRWTQQYLIPQTLLQCDLATPHQEVESVALTLQSGLLLMTSLNNWMLQVTRYSECSQVGSSEAFQLLLVTVGALALEILWEAHTTQRSHMWVLQVTSQWSSQSTASISCQLCGEACWTSSLVKVFSWLQPQPRLAS